MEEAEIRRLEHRLASVSVIDEEKAKALHGVVFVGCMVKMRDVDTDDVDLYRLVGQASSSPPLDYVEVTATSPMGEAMAKARVGDVVRVNAPRGVKKFEILEIN